MSLTSYRAAPPRGRWCVCGFGARWEVLGLGVCVSSLLGGPGGDLLFHALRRSTIGAEGFHGRVRDGIGCFTLAMATRSSKQRRGLVARWCVFVGSVPMGWCLRCFVVFRCVFGRLCPERVGVLVCADVGFGYGFVRTHGVVWWFVKPVERLGPVSCTRCRASTSGLSTWWSSTALGETWF